MNDVRFQVFLGDFLLVLWVLCRNMEITVVRMTDG